MTWQVGPAPGGPPPLVLVNERAGRGAAAARLERIIRRSGAILSTARVVSVSSPPDVRAALARIEPGQIPLVAGGDGSVAMVAAELLREGPGTVPLAILPLGTGNIVATIIGVRTMKDALEALRNPTVRRLDVMRTSSLITPVALVSISTGFEGDFLQRYGARRHLGRAAAALAGLPLVGRRATGIYLEADDEVLIRPGEAVFSVGIYNTRCYAGGVVMSPDADPADGWFEVVAYRRAIDYWGRMAAGITGRGRSSIRVLHRRSRTASLSGNGPFQVDGEPLPPGNLRVNIDPLALPLLATAKWSCSQIW